MRVVNVFPTTTSQRLGSTDSFAALEKVYSEEIVQETSFFSVPERFVGRELVTCPRRAPGCASRPVRCIVWLRILE